MPRELPTIEIVSPKDPTQRWTINASDFDPAKHTRWSDRQAEAAAPTIAAPEPETPEGQPASATETPGAAVDDPDIPDEAPPRRRGRPPKSAVVPQE